MPGDDEGSALCAQGSEDWPDVATGEGEDPVDGRRRQYLGDQGSSRCRSGHEVEITIVGRAQSGGTTTTAHVDGGTMRALFFPRARTFEVRRVPIPQPGPGEARVRVLLCGICGSDLSVYQTGALAGPDAVMGHEVVAEVEFDPTGTHAPGDRVVVFPPRGCGECYWCRRGEPRHCERPGDERWGGYAEYAVYPADHLLPVPAGLSSEVATLADPVGVAARAMETARPAPGDVAYVNGLGPIGLSVVSMLLGLGCRVIGGDLREDRRKMAEFLGPVQTIDPYREDPYEMGREIDPAGPTLAFECSGSPQGLQEIFDAAGPGGTVAILGIPKQPVLLLRMTVREQNAFSIAGPTLSSMKAALDHLVQDSRLAGIITSTVSLEEAREAFDGLVEAQGDVKVLVDPRR